jgi:hypothetical protein
MLRLGAGGQMTMAPNGSLLLTVFGLDCPPLATVDLTNNAMVARLPGDALGTIRALVTSGYAGGTWTGSGITSSSAAITAGRGVGYGDAGSLAIVPPVFGSVEAGDIILRYTLLGDATLDRTVNLTDFNALSSNFGQSNRPFTRGDFNYDNVVNLSDFNLLAARFGQSIPSEPLSAIRVYRLDAWRVDRLPDDLMA